MASASVRIDSREAVEMVPSLIWAVGCGLLTEDEAIRVAADAVKCVLEQAV
jgi:hypothetical protein